MSIQLPITDGEPPNWDHVSSSSISNVPNTFFSNLNSPTLDTCFSLLDQLLYIFFQMCYSIDIERYINLLLFFLQWIGFICIKIRSWHNVYIFFFNEQKSMISYPVVKGFSALISILKVRYSYNIRTIICSLCCRLRLNLIYTYEYTQKTNRHTDFFYYILNQIRDKIDINDKIYSIYCAFNIPNEIWVLKRHSVKIIFLFVVNKILIWKLLVRSLVDRNSMELQ